MVMAGVLVGDNLEHSFGFLLGENTTQDVHEGVKKHLQLKDQQMQAIVDVYRFENTIHIFRHCV